MRCLTVGIILGVGWHGAPAFAQHKAFPEAEGFGQFATGGRTNLASATVYHVTNLNDSGAGSFRDAVSQPNRFVVFDVGGIVTLNSLLTVASNLTIAGQTAPGGFAVYGDRVSFTNANNLISRYFAIRKGEAGIREDAAGLARGTNMMFDHMSITWGVDGTFDINPDSGFVIDNLTIQNTVIAQGLDRLGHSTGGLMTLSEGRHFSVIKSLFADNVTRNPKARGENEFINNVVYGWESDGYIMGDTTGTSNANVEGNYFIEGPVDGGSPFTNGTSSFHIYAQDNWVDTNRNGVLDGTPISSYPGADVIAARHNFPTAASMTAQQALQHVMNNVGVNITRDAVDMRLVQEVASYGTLGGVIDYDTDVFPGYGTDPAYLNPRARLVDGDNDGMADNWETSRGYNPASASDWKTVTASGYTRLEEYLNELGGPQVDKVWTAPSGTWPNGASWSGGTVPKISDQAFVLGGGAGTNGQVNIASGNAFARRLFIGGNGAAAGERVAVIGGTLDVFDTLHVGHANHATLEISGGVVSAGVVLLGGNGGGSNHTGTLNLLTGGTLQTAFIRQGAGGTAAFNWNGGTLKAISTPNIEAPATLGPSGGTFDTNGYSGAYAGVLGGAGGLRKTGSGTLTLNPNNAYTGPTTITGGVIAVSALANANAPSHLGASTNDAANLVLDGGTLRYTTTSSTATSTDRLFTLTSRGGTLDAGSVGQWRFTATGTIGAPGPGDRTLVLTGTTTLSDLFVGISDPTGGGKTTVRKEGTGRWIFSTPATPRSYSGDTVINAGTLMTNHDNPLPFGAGKGNLLINAGSFEMNGRNLSINGLNGAGTLNQRGNNTSRTLTLGHGDGGGTFSGILSDVPSTAGTPAVLNVVKTGAGTQTFSGTANTYEGSTSLLGGTLTVASLANVNTPSSIGLGSAAGSAADLVFNGGTLRHAGSAAQNTDRLFTLGTGASAGRIDASSSSNAAVSFTGTGAVAFTGTGTRTLTLTGSSTGANTLAPIIGDGAGATAGTAAVVKSGAGTWNLTGVNTFTGGTTVQAGRLNVKRLHENNPVSITGGTLQVAESVPGLSSGLASGNNASLSRPSSLTIAAGGTLDLTNNDLILDYTDPGASPAAAIEALIAQGYRGGDWLGTGITSSVARQDGNYALAVADNALLTTAYESFSGQTVDATTVLVKFTWVDDIDLDGKVTTNDAITFGNNYSLGDPATHITGDMDYDGVFTTNDAIVFGNNYDTTLPSLPEPGVVSMLWLAVATGLRRRLKRPVETNGRLFSAPACRENALTSWSPIAHRGGLRKQRLCLRQIRV